MFTSLLFFCFALLMIPKETRANALVFVFGFSAFQFRDLIDDLLIHLLFIPTDEDVTFIYALSATIIYGILNKLNIKNNYISYVASILELLVFVNLIGWLMYESNLEPFYYDLASNGLILIMLAIMTWSLPSGRNFIKNRYISMVYSFNSKSDSIQAEQRKEKGLQR